MGRALHVVLEVKTDRFTGTAPRDGLNDLIGGDELANWLSAALREDGFGAVDPWPEDHGWDFAVRHNDIVYLVTCSCDFEDYDRAAADFFVQIVVARSLMDRLLGRRKIDAASDPVVAAIRALLGDQADMQVIDQDAEMATAP
jgi:hypothetical protein